MGRLVGHRVSLIAEAGGSVGAVSFCRVSAGGAPADWVEATSAFLDQSTLVWFVSGRDPGASVHAVRSAAAALAVRTGARILTVGCRAGAYLVQDGVAAYAWLIGEGSDVARRGFVAGYGAGPLAFAVRQAAIERGLPAARLTHDCIEP